jgi:hypothetical protein
LLSSISLHRLLYVSTVTDEAASRLPSTLEDILLVSAHWNTPRQVSGFLLCDGVSFAQVLEGPLQAVEACFDRIFRDHRHTNLRVRLKTAAERRLFGRWSMCGLSLSDADDAALTPTDIEIDVEGAAPEAMLRHLSMLAQRYSAELDAVHDRMVATQSPF